MTGLKIYPALCHVTRTSNQPSRNHAVTSMLQVTNVVIELSVSRINTAIASKIICLFANRRRRYSNFLQECRIRALILINLFP